MKHLYDAGIVAGIQERIGSLTAAHTPRWGKMDAAQMLAHCSTGFAMARGEFKPRRILLGRILGPLVKRSLIVRGEPMRPNSITTPEMLVTDARDFEAERRRLAAEVDRFAADGPAAVTTHPHMFFGRLTPVEWASLMYQHVDHHLRQFGA